jgi:hypothetical protein
MRRLLFLTVLLAGLLVGTIGCRDRAIFVLPEGLAVGDDSTSMSDRPQLDIVVRMMENSDNFNAFDLMQLVVNGTDEATSMVIGGRWAVYTIPAPGNANFEVDLNRRLGENIDRGSFVTAPYSGPTLTSVSPDTAMVGTTVTLTGTGFDSGVARVFFGGVEGTVDSTTATQIVATVPEGAIPGIVWVILDADAAEGIIGFQPLDLAGEPVPISTTKRIDAIFPARGKRETVIRVYGHVFDRNHSAFFNGATPDQVLNVQTITVSPIGDVLTCFALPNLNTAGGAVNFKLERDRIATNILPFVVEDE